ncbi:Na+/H+ antiporter NhaC [Yersinia frederiksenii]|uniref:Na+/H+ antiporter NhaC n=2 Tax=Yersinia frederiksenii TaxID=29484 RepID=A0A380PRB4_YERFR|nr:Na+/H+ antiporter NhaC family protein [Yersinia frederiksenii]ATM95580.1 Na+/H+ antiporter NhaC [Yersinia frederiksenii]KGA43874.1 na+/H+ antiporter family protein [Yersinia frederiksenii ATCC 33641]MDN0117918.1 Na+/H+ antiporter NhaC family protein [Yersinia frederiksenii]CNC80153.1 Na+/H+ antiporter NhaC [Yersinia frederiksenii]CNG36646.1 Na+/H+ antiporter NhaC [Yersinia frederiksenii]
MDIEPKSPRAIKAPSYLDALIPVVSLIVLVGSSVALFGLNAVNGPLQVAIIISTMITSIIILKNGHSWEAISESGRKGIATVSGAIFILFSVGALIGTWNMSGTIPTMVYYGIVMITPNWFYPIAFLVCIGVSLSIGSSWTTAGTLGVGLVGLANMLGLSPEITAGAVISGAYVGDKVSPLSESTVLAAQLNGVELYKHIRTQLWTTVPAAFIALIAFIVLGMNQQSAFDITITNNEMTRFNELFHITPWNLLPLFFLLTLSILKVPASLAIMCSALLAGIMTSFMQPQVIMRFIAEPDVATPLLAIKAIWVAMATGFQENSGIEQIDALLSRGGMDSMLLTIWLIIGAVTFGIMVDDFGLLNKLVTPLLLRARTVGRLIASVVATAIGLNIAAGDQYIALLLPTRLYRAEFAKRGLAPENLSRAVSDAGIVTSPLIPWNSCGAYMAAVLGVSTMAYMPFAVFNIAAPLITLVLGVTGFNIRHIPKTTAELKENIPESKPVQ